MNLSTVDDPIWLTKMDPLADEAVLAILREGGPKLLNLSLEVLSNDPPPDAWPKGLREFVRSIPAPTTLEEQRLEQAQKAFMTFGVLGVSVLSCASLPETYVLPGIAKLLAMSGQLTEHVGRRLEMTGQMLFDVMTPRSLLPGGVALKAVLRTRLMHAALRYMLLHEMALVRDTDAPEVQKKALTWTAEYGQPINQLELAYTLMTFSHVVLRSVVALGIEPQPGMFDDYIYTWNIVGELLGVDPALLPDSQEEAAQLFERIKAVHARRTDDSVRLMADLEHYWVAQWPILVRHAAAPVMHAICERVLSPETREMLDLKVERSLLQSEVELLMKPAATGLRLAEHMFLRLPSTAHLAAVVIQHWANRRTHIPDGGLNDTHQHMIDAWFEHENHVQV